MNWVGGPRSRCMRKDDTSRLRAFFQKQRMKRKSTSKLTQGQNAGNMDLLSLFIANQLASKKEQTSNPVINHLNSPKRTKHAWNRCSQFPKRSCPPSNLNLGSGQLQYSVNSPGLKLRKHRLNKEFQLKLSPLVESNMSDGSGSENRHQPSSSSAGSKGPIKPHASFTLQPTVNTGNMKITTQPTMLNNPWLLTDPAENILQNSPEIRLQFESTLPNPEMGEHSETLVLFPLSCSESSEDIDCEVFASQNSCDRSQNLDKDRFFSTQEEEKIQSQQSCSNKELGHSEDTLTADHLFLPVISTTATPSQAPSCIQMEKLFGCQNQTEALRHDGNSIITLDEGTQTAALSTREVSVQCSLLHHKATRRQSFHQLLNPIRLRSSKDMHRRTRSRPSGASATNHQAQTHPKSQPEISFHKLRRSDIQCGRFLPQSLRTDKAAAMVMKSQTTQV